MLSCVVAEASRYLYGQVRDLARLRGEDDFALRGSTLKQPEKDIVDAMKKCFFEHTPPPVCLGVKSGNLGHRFQAMLHSLSLLCNGGAALESFLKSLVGICTDLGTESMLNRIKPIALSDTLPWTLGPAVNLRDDDEVDNDDDSDEEPPMRGQQRPMFVEVGELDFCDGGEFMAPPAAMADVTSSLGIAGMLHILHNATNDIGLIIKIKHNADKTKQKANRNNTDIESRPQHAALQQARGRHEIGCRHFAKETQQGTVVHHLFRGRGWHTDAEVGDGHRNRRVRHLFFRSMHI